MSRLKDQYNNEIVDALIKKFGYKNRMQVPKLDKIVVNMGVGEAKENAKVLEAAVKDLETITGQKAILTKAKNSIANFKIREGMPIGCKVTLRGERMYEFLDRLVNLALPRVYPLDDWNNIIIKHHFQIINSPYNLFIFYGPRWNKVSVSQQHIFILKYIKNCLIQVLRQFVWFNI